jgi:hypothetical protein
MWPPVSLPGSPPLTRLEMGGKRAEAKQDHVAVPELARVVMVIGMADLPEDVAVPVDLEGGAALEATPGLEALQVPHDLAGVEEVAVVEQVPVGARTVGGSPGVDDLAKHVHEVDGAVAEHRAAQRVALEGMGGIVSDEPSAGPAHPLLVDRRHDVNASSIISACRR